MASTSLRAATFFAALLALAGCRDSPAPRTETAPGVSHAGWIRVTYVPAWPDPLPERERSAAREAIRETLALRVAALSKPATVELDGDRLVLEVPPIAEGELRTLRALIERRGALRIHLVAESSAFAARLHDRARRDQTAAERGIEGQIELRPAEAGEIVEHTLSGPSRAALKTFVEEARRDDPAISLEAGHELVFEPLAATVGDGRQRRWATVVIEASPVLTDRDLADARVRENAATGSPDVVLTFGAEAAAALSTVTAHHRGRRLAILLDDRVNSVPVIFGPVEGGQLTLSLEGAGETATREGVALSLALRAGSLPVALVQESVGLVP